MNEETTLPRNLALVTPPDMTDSDKLDAIYRQNEMILERFDQILAIANDIKGEVSPLIARLESHPMAKMFLGGK